MTDETKRRKKVVVDVEQVADDAVELPIATVQDENEISEMDTPPAEVAHTAVVKVSPVALVDGRWRMEWKDEEGRLHQGWSDQHLDAAPLDVLAGLEPYGDDLTKLFDPVSIAPQDVAEWLHRAGVWTYKDVTTRVLRDVFAGFAQDLSASVHARKGELAGK